MDQNLQRATKLDTTALSDALDRLGIPGQCLGIKPLDHRFRLAGRAYAHTAAYDAAVANWFGTQTLRAEPGATLADLEAWGLGDAFRTVYDAPGVYSWWDYRAGDFHEGRGMRIDLVMMSAPLLERVSWAIIDRNARKGSQPSDHAPVVVDLRDES